MADVQLENGHIRIANSLYDEILKRDFSKREQNAILFILRYSYGFRLKAVHIKHLSIFEQCGIARQDIKKVLTNLKENKVIFWDESLNIIQFNKNYDEWIIKPHKYFVSEKLTELVKYIHHCKQNTYTIVSKILMTGLVKHLQCESGNPQPESITHPPTDNNRHIKTDDRQASSSDFLKTSDKAGFIAKIRHDKDFNEKVSETCPLDCDLESYYDSLCMNNAEALIHQALSSYMTGKFKKFGISAAGFQSDFANWLAQEKPKKVEKTQQDGISYPKFKPEAKKRESPLDFKIREEAIDFLKNLPKRMRGNPIPQELIEKWNISQEELESNEIKTSDTS
jgi:phage replication O-like protein O